MGRYDRMQVYYNGGWHQPYEVQVYNGSRYVTLGNNTSSNTEHIYVHTSGGSYPRVTLYRRDYTIPGESYAYGSISLTPASNAGWNPHSATVANHYIRGWIRKTTNSEVTIFESGNSSGTCKLKITWLADGKLQLYFRSSYHRSGTNPTTFTTDNAVGANQWVYFELFAAKGTASSNYGFSVTFNGQKKNGSTYNTWAITNATNKIGGSSSLQFKGTFEVSLARYQASDDTSRVAQWSINMDSNPVRATSGTISQSMTVTNTSSTGTEWV